MPETKRPRVFISYSWDGNLYKKWVREVADLLNSMEIEVELDQYHELQPPLDGWSIWMLQQIKNADYVLVMCTDNYRKAAEGDPEPEQTGGKGRRWESMVIRQNIYDHKGKNSRFVPIIPPDSKVEDVPLFLRDTTQYKLSEELADCDELKKLHKRLIAPIKSTEPEAKPVVLQQTIPVTVPLSNSQEVDYSSSCRRLDGPNDPLLKPMNGIFEGRDNEVAEVMEFLNGEGCGAEVTAAITEGTGGVGKTEVCKAALAKWMQMWQDPVPAVYFVSLRGAENKADFLTRLSQAIGEEKTLSEHELFQRLKELPGIYYLDNVESVANDGPALQVFSRLCADYYRVRILASSRRSLTGGCYSIVINTLPNEAAVSVFRKIWRRSGGNELPVTDLLKEFVGVDMPENYPRILPDNLARHALSIKLVASHGKGMTLERIIDRWKRNGLALATVDMGEDHLKSLEASIRLSLSFFKDRTNTVLLWGLVSLFPEGMTEHAWNYCLENRVASEKDRSLLIQHHILDDLNGRLTILPPLARFAMEYAKVGRDGFSIKRIVKSLQNYFLAIAAKGAKSLFSGAKSNEDLPIVLEALPAIYKWALIAIENGVAESKNIGNLSFSMLNICQYRSYISVEFLDKLRNYFIKNGMLMQLSNNLYVTGDLKLILGDVEAARCIFMETIRLSEKEKFNASRANALMRLGDLESHMGNFDEARRLYLEAISLFEKERNDFGRNLGRANALRSLGDLESRLGKVDEARRLYLEAIPLYEKVRDDLGRANALQNLGDLESRLGNIDEARRLYLEAILLYEKERHDLSRAGATVSLGYLEYKLDNIDVALDLYNTAHLLSEKIHDNSCLGNCLRGTGDVECRKGNIESAERKYQDAISFYSKAQSKEGLAYVYKAIGDLRQKHGGKYSEALTFYDDARIKFEEIKNLEGQGEVWTEIARMRHKQGEHELAVEALKKAKEFAEKSHSHWVKKGLEELQAEMRGENK